MHNEVYKRNATAKGKTFTKQYSDPAEDFSKWEISATRYHYFPLEMEMEKESEGSPWGETEGGTIETISLFPSNLCPFWTFGSSD